MACSHVRPIVGMACRSFTLTPQNIQRFDRKHTIAWPLDAGTGKAMGQSNSKRSYGAVYIRISILFVLSQVTGGSKDMACRIEGAIAIMLYIVGHRCKSIQSRLQ